MGRCHQNARMCFITHMATQTPPVLFERMANPPGTALKFLQDQYAAVRDKFSLPHVAELKLAEGCGCWLRYVDCDDPEYHVDLMVRMPKYDASEKQSNHDSLADFLEANFRQDDFVEFFGYFNGYAAQPARAQREIIAADIRHPHFHFHGGTLYRIWC